MRAVIVGCGRTGAALAAQLSAAGNDVTILDVHSDAFRRLPSGFAGSAVRGDGTDEDVLRRAGAEGADAFFSLTEGDNRNVLAAQLASESLGISTVVAKINDPVRADAYASLGIGTLCRTELLVDALLRYLDLPGVPEAVGVRAPTGTHHPDGRGDHGALRPVDARARTRRSGNGSQATSDAPATTSDASATTSDAPATSNSAPETRPTDGPQTKSGG